MSLETIVGHLNAKVGQRMNKKPQEIETKITIKPNCKDVIVEFQEGGDAGFNLKLLITPEQAVGIAQRLVKAAESLGGHHG